MTTAEKAREISKEKLTALGEQLKMRKKEPPEESELMSRLPESSGTINYMMHFGKET